MATLQEPLEGHLVSGRVFLWSVQAALWLRRERRIVVEPTGTLVNHTVQNVFLGPPYLVPSEAARLLLDSGDMTLLDGAIHMPPTAVRAAQERRQRTDIAMAQMRHFLATEPAPTHEHGGSLRGDAAPAPKRARTQPPAATPETTSAAATPVAKAGSGTTAAASATAADASGATADVSTPAAAGSAPPTVAEGEAAVSEAPSPAPVQTVLPWQLNEKDVLAWLKFPWAGRGKEMLQSRTGSLPNLQNSALATDEPNTVWAALKQVAVRVVENVRHVLPMLPPRHLARQPRLHPSSFKYPTTIEEYRRCLVYTDLLQRGYFLTSGSKFGGDFLVYAGDPYRYHSHFVARVLPHDSTVSPLDLVSAGRLGTVVKKSPLLCTVDDDDQVHYLSVEWTGAN